MRVRPRNARELKAAPYPERDGVEKVANWPGPIASIPVADNVYTRLAFFRDRAIYRFSAVRFASVGI